MWSTAGIGGMCCVIGGMCSTAGNKSVCSAAGNREYVRGYVFYCWQ